jgi:hypothetical protein
VLALDATWEVVTLLLPHSDDIALWKQKLILHAILVGAMFGCALAGGFIGFWFFPVGARLSVGRLIAIGVLFMVLAFFVVGLLLVVGGPMWTCIGLATLAVVVVQSAGRLFAGRVA